MLVHKSRLGSLQLASSSGNPPGKFRTSGPPDRLHRRKSNVFYEERQRRMNIEVSGKGTNLLGHV